MVRIGHGISLLALTLALGTTTACKKKAAEPAAGSGSAAMTGSDMGSGSAAMAGSGSAMVGSGSDMAGSGSAGSAAMTDTGSGAGSAADGTTMSNKGGNCPSLVFGATTTAKVEKDVVVVMVTSTDKDAVAAIHKRAAMLIKEKADSTAKEGSKGTGHDKKGTQGGATGICPIYFSDGTGAATNDKTGTIVRLIPRGGSAEELKKKIDDRITKSNEWMKTNVKEGDKGTTGGVGGGEGKHGSVHAGSGDSKGKERGTGGGGGSGTGSGTGGGDKKGTGGGDKKK